jgi:hypothetical protein
MDSKRLDLLLDDIKIEKKMPKKRPKDNLCK